MFFNFDQNNSGGSFIRDDVKGITDHVIIEALDSVSADQIAESIGLYFDGEGDCPCCGDRWSNCYGDGTEEPMYYNEPVTQARGHPWRDDGKDICVHYLDGRKEWFPIKKRQYA